MSNLLTDVTRTSRLTHRKTPPGPSPSHLLLGNAGDMQRDPLGFQKSMVQQYGDLIRIRFVVWPSYLVYHPDHVKHILQGNNQNYNKDIYNYKALQALVGQGLVTNDGQSWLHQRRLIQPAFHRKRLATFGTLMTNATVAMLEQWHSFQRSSQSLDVAAEMMRLTQRIIGQALFNIDLKELDIVGQAFTAVTKSLTEYIYAPFPPLSVPTPRNRRFQDGRRKLDSVVQSIIAEHRRRNTDSGDLLSMLVLARDEETGQGMNDQQVRDEVITLLLAGHETTANALTWIWYLLSQHPEVEQRLHAELEQVLGGQVPTIEHLPKLVYTRMIFEEAIRLYPPAWLFGRKVLANDELGGYHIPANSFVLLSPYMTHRHPEFWQNPDVFDPERFAPEREASRPHYAYFPFGGGPRLCIGSNFAMMEAQLILATVAQRHRLRLVPNHPVEPEALLTVRPRYGMLMTLHH